MAAMDVKW